MTNKQKNILFFIVSKCKLSFIYTLHTQKQSSRCVWPCCILTTVYSNSQTSWNKEYVRSYLLLGIPRLKRATLHQVRQQQHNYIS
jgi:hypothetical protein